MCLLHLTQLRRCPPCPPQAMSKKAEGATSSGNERDCSICCEKLPAASFRAMASCGHDSACGACVLKHINEEINGKRGIRILCLQSGCNEELAERDLRACAPQTLSVWHKNQLLSFITKSKDFRWCALGCGFGQESENGEQLPIVTCQKCKHKYCFRHGVAWHTDRTCDQFQEYLDQNASSEEANMAWISANTRRCPQCRHGIEKNGGCDHMTCARDKGGCGAEFCFVCGADYGAIRQRGNAEHQPTCIYHSDNL